MIPAVMDTLLAQLASAQYGLVTRSQLLAAGFTDKMIETRLARGWLEVVHPGVYRVAGAPRSWHQDMLGALFHVGDAAVASHRAAARLWGLDGPFDGLVELSASLLSGARPHGALAHRSTDLIPPYTTVRFGIPVTKPARTLLDLGAVVPRHVLDRAVDDAAGLERARTALEDLGHRLDETGIPDTDLAFNLTWHDWINLKNLILVSRAITAAAIARENSCGAHYRADFPNEAVAESSEYVSVVSRDGRFGLARHPVQFTRVRPGESLIKNAAA